MLGYDARRAIEVTVAATLLTPLLGPLTVALLLARATALSPLELARNLGLMVAGGVGLAVGAPGGRRPGADRRARAHAFDGRGGAGAGGAGAAAVRRRAAT